MTNNKIKMSQKNGVPDPIMELATAAQNKDLEGVISALVALDDEKFNLIKDKLETSITEIFSSTEFQNHVNEQIKMLPNFNMEEEKAGYQGLVNTIEELDITDEKKNLLKKIMEASYSGVLRYEKDPSKHIKVIFKKLSEDAIVPTYAHLGDAGADLYASEDCVVGSDIQFIHTGIALSIPKGYEGQIRPRSGLSAKTGLRIANTPGTIDSNYRGEIQILMENKGAAPYFVRKGDRIAQIVFSEVPTADFIEGEVETEEDNTRGTGGFGSSGTAENNNEQVSD